MILFLSLFSGEQQIGRKISNDKCLIDLGQQTPYEQKSLNILN